MIVVSIAMTALLLLLPARAGAQAADGTVGPAAATQRSRNRTAILRPGALSEAGPPAAAFVPPPSLFSDTSDPYQHIPPATERPSLVSNWSSLVPDDIDISVVQWGIKLTIKNIHFEAGSDRFLYSEYPRLDALAAALRELPRDRIILVDGHSIAVGAPAGEMDISFLRARRLVEALKSRGIDGDRLVFRALGGTQPLASNTTDVGRYLNRRAEIFILNEGEPLP
jgi:outer membrane protein OmpA-like peptidoglycan-associated protein